MRRPARPGRGGERNSGRCPSPARARGHAARVSRPGPRRTTYPLSVVRLGASGASAGADDPWAQSGSSAAPASTGRPHRPARFALPLSCGWGAQGGVGRTDASGWRLGWDARGGWGGPMARRMGRVRRVRRMRRVHGVRRVGRVGRVAAVGRVARRTVRRVRGMGRVGGMRRGQRGGGAECCHPLEASGGRHQRGEGRNSGARGRGRPCCPTGRRGTDRGRRGRRPGGRRTVVGGSLEVAVVWRPTGGSAVCHGACPVAATPCRRTGAGRRRRSRRRP